MLRGQRQHWHSEFLQSLQWRTPYSVLLVLFLLFWHPAGCSAVAIGSRHDEVVDPEDPTDAMEWVVVNSGGYSHRIHHTIAEAVASKMSEPFPAGFVHSEHGSDSSKRRAADSAAGLTNTSIASADTGEEAQHDHESATVVTGSVLLSVLSDVEDGPLVKADYDGLSIALHRALSEAIEVCQTAVRVVDMRAMEAESVVELRQRLQPPEGQGVRFSLARRLNQLMRRASILQEKPKRHRHQHLNVTEVKGSYEVRIFKEMNVPETTVVNRIDQLQLYSRFADFGNLLTRTISTEDLRFAALVTLDDVSRALPRTEKLPPVPRDAASTCVEEELLHRARWIHQYVLLASMVMVVMIVWTGSAVFTLKQPSVVPSRMNPLIPSS